MLARRVMAGLVLALALARAGSTAEPTALSLTGSVAHPQRLTAAELRHLPATTVEMHYTKPHGAQQATYIGTLLWPLLDQASLIDSPGTKTHLQHIIVARGADGYAVALSLGELDPALEGKPVLIAYQQDGKPLGALKLVVPGDKRPARAVRELISIEVR